MAETIEKIYCTDGRDNDLAAILATTKNKKLRQGSKLLKVPFKK